MLPFIKMHGLGNDFVIFDGRCQDVALSPIQIRAIANRRTGIGCDQIGIIRHSNSPNTHIRLDIFNADGSIAGACGNLTRCVASLIGKESSCNNISIQTSDRIVECVLHATNIVTANMGRACFSPPLNGSIAQLLNEVAWLQNNVLHIIPVCVGNPHCVIIVNDLESLDVKQLGPQISNSPIFPNQTNVEFCQIITEDTVSIKIWERGSGYSVACGTGACAVASAVAKIGIVSSKYTIEMPGGRLTISILPSYDILMTGMVSYSFSGNLELSLL